MTSGRQRVPDTESSNRESLVGYQLLKAWLVAPAELMSVKPGRSATGTSDSKSHQIPAIINQ